LSITKQARARHTVMAAALQVLREYPDRDHTDMQVWTQLPTGTPLRDVCRALAALVHAGQATMRRDNSVRSRPRYYQATRPHRRRP
jgi:hypothetical protein